MTRDEMQELKRLAESATPGPWSHFGKFDTQHVVEAPMQMVCNTLHANDEPNARFIAAAHPQAVLALIARIEELEGK